MSRIAALVSDHDSLCLTLILELQADMHQLKPWVKAHHIRRINYAHRRAGKANDLYITRIGIPAYQDAAAGSIVSTLGPDGVSSRRQIGQVRPVPRSLTFRDAYDETAAFLNEVARSINESLDRPEPILNRRERRRRLRSAPPIGSYWDFSTVEHMTILPALMLAAHYDRAGQIRPQWRPRAINMHRWQPQVREFLEDVGFLELCGITTKTAAAFHYRDGSLLRFRRGEKADGEAIGTYFQEMGLDLFAEKPLLFEAITEAITNVVNHAYSYSDLCSPHSVNGWWLCGMVSSRDGQRKISIVVYDQGASIPRTLPYSTKFVAVCDWFLSLFGVNYDIDDTGQDAKAIQGAMQLGASATGEQYRGRGLVQIMDALNLCSHGQLSIYSRFGSVLVEKQESGATEVSPVNHSTPIIGTAIVWHLTL